MRRVDAPPAGWYPDPENRARLRWWDGLDWADIRRAPPSQAELSAYEEVTRLDRPPPSMPTDMSSMQQMARGGGMSRMEAQDLITEVRTAAREEVDRAAEQFTQRTQAAIRSVTPLVTNYTNQVLRWVRAAAIIATVLVIAWFLFQVILQQSLFDWLGDRIDNITDESGAPIGGGQLPILVDQVPGGG